MDRQIYELVEPLLYNGGRGKLVPLSKIWMSRMGKLGASADEAEGEAQRAQETKTGAKEPARYRWVCWKLEERGFVGESALHICFLLSTPTHMILAKKLLAMFPMLINDIYTCDEYFGESSLVSWFLFTLKLFTSKPERSTLSLTKLLQLDFFLRFE